MPAVKRKSNSCEVADKSKKKKQEVSKASVEDNVRQDCSGYSLERMKNFLQHTKRNEKC